MRSSLLVWLVVVSTGCTCALPFDYTSMEDGGMDAGDIDAAGFDAGDVDAGFDGGMSMMDAGDVDAGPPPDSGPVCPLADRPCQPGTCGATRVCVRSPDGSWSCQATMGAMENNDCQADAECADGLVCVANRCRRYCDECNACPGTWSTCLDPVRPEIQHCSVDCFPGEMGPCPPTEVCNFRMVGGRWVPGCQATTPVAGPDCNGGPPCSAGLVCMRNEFNVEGCRSWCRPGMAEDCASGFECLPRDVFINDMQLGVCIPSR